MYKHIYNSPAGLITEPAAHPRRKVTGHCRRHCQILVACKRAHIDYSLCICSRVHLAFRLTAPIRGLEAVEHGVGAGGADRARIEVLREWAGDESAAEREYRCRVLIPAAGQCLQHPWAGGQQLSASPSDRINERRLADLKLVP